MPNNDSKESRKQDERDFYEFVDELAKQVVTMRRLGKLSHSVMILSSPHENDTVILQQGHRWATIKDMRNSFDESMNAIASLISLTARLHNFPASAILSLINSYFEAGFHEDDGEDNFVIGDDSTSICKTLGYDRKDVADIMAEAKKLILTRKEDESDEQ